MNRHAFHREVKEPPSYQGIGEPIGLFADPVSKAGALPTSEKAAQTAKMTAQSVAAQMLAIYALSSVPLTPDQVASRLGKGVLTVRPRASQALTAGYLRETEQEVPTEHGGTATALEITDRGRRVVKGLGLLR